MNGNRLWVAVAGVLLAAVLALFGKLVQLDRDRIESTATEAKALAMQNSTQVAVMTSRLVEIQATLDEIKASLKESHR